MLMKAMVIACTAILSGCAAASAPVAIAPVALADDSPFDRMADLARSKPSPSAGIVSSVIPGKPAPPMSVAIMQFDSIEIAQTPPLQRVQRASYYLYITIVCRVFDGHEYSYARGWVTGIDGKTPKPTARIYLSVAAHDRAVVHRLVATEESAMVDHKLGPGEQSEATTATLKTYEPDDEITFVVRKCE